MTHRGRRDAYGSLLTLASGSTAQYTAWECSSRVLLSALHLLLLLCDLYSPLLYTLYTSVYPLYTPVCILHNLHIYFIGYKLYIFDSLYSLCISYWNLYSL